MFQGSSVIGPSVTCQLVEGEETTLFVCVVWCSVCCWLCLAGLGIMGLAMGVVCWALQVGFWELRGSFFEGCWAHAGLQIDCWEAFVVRFGTFWASNWSVLGPVGGVLGSKGELFGTLGATCCIQVGKLTPLVGSWGSMGGAWKPFGAIL